MATPGQYRYDPVKSQTVLVKAKKSPGVRALQVFFGALFVVILVSLLLLGLVTIWWLILLMVGG